ncbi:hypothetical protein EUX98_g1946 [Antrodiella citrinella]|uniref:N-terminal Ras-GEF domain-containing protein n=1 Tax=Antrodiella citrinella TaxID=2447956 RepID=A0A4S4N1Q8_9APHY|nr:hypothetical protein EUX98_g1946 [Antrodiella citrinella]
MLNQVSSRPDHSRPSHRKRSASSASVAKQAAVTGHVHPRASRQLPAPPSRLVLASSTELRETESLLGLAGSGSTQQETDIVLFGRVRKAIAVLSEYIHTVGPTEQLNYGKVNERVTAVVEEVKVLLCVNAMPVEDAWYDTIPDDIRRTCTPRYVAERVRSSYWKVIGTLSSLVTTTIAVQHDPAHSVVDSRLEMTLPDLENTIKEFIKEVQHMKQDASHSSSRRFAKSYRGKFLTSEAGFRSPGAGSAGGWKGLGYVQNPGQSLRALNASVIAELNVLVGPIERKFLGLMASSSVHSKTDRLHSEGREIASQLAQLLQFLGGLDVTRLQNEVDGDIAERHHLIRTLEAAMQALYDDSAVFLSTLQTSGSLEALGRSSSRSDPMGALVTAIMANLSLTISTLKTLLSSHEQDAANSPRSQAAASPRPSTVFVSEATLVPDLGTSPNRSNDDAQGGDIVDMEQALYMRPSVKINTIRGPRRPVTTRSSLHVPAVPSRSSLADERASSPFRSGTPTRGQHLRSPSTEQSPVSQTETGPNKSPHRATKLFQILGRDAPRHYIDNMNTDSKPWYLRPTYVQSEIRIEPSGEVTAGTRAALVERLTAHDHGDPVFTKDFLMTFKSFMTVNELFDMLVERFWIESPDGLNDGELKEWTSLKQHVIRTRVLNNLKSMIVDDDILESSDMHILKAMHDFISTRVLEAKAAKQILPMIELRQRGSKAKVKVPYTPMTAPPTPLIPKSRDFKLLDIEPLELARQLTLIEFALYKKIRPSECLRRVREPNADKSSDSIAAVIRLNTKVVCVHCSVKVPVLTVFS